MTRKPFYHHLYFQVLIAIIFGVFVGTYFKDFAVALKPLGDAFIKLIKMVVAPIIFTTVVIGMAGMGSLKRVGRVGFKAFIYFEIMTTLALIIGYAVVKWLEPGIGVDADPSKLDAKIIQDTISAGQKTHGFVPFMMNIIPTSIVDAFARGDIIQVLFFSVLFGFALSALGEAGKPMVHLLEIVSDALMKVIAIIVKLAPIAAFGAIAFTTGKLGIESLGAQFKLMICVYVTCLIFVCALLGVLLKLNGISLWKFLKFIREEIFIVLGTASSESVLPRMMTRMEQFGCSPPLTRLVLPAGYSFNMDGSCIYLTMAAIFIAQATNSHLTAWQELMVILVCLVTSKGAAGVVGSAFITLAATLSSLNTVVDGKVVSLIPVEGMVLILGVDRLMAEARSVTNLIGNGVATILISKWEGEFDAQKSSAALETETPATIQPAFVESPSNIAGSAAEKLRQKLDS